MCRKEALIEWTSRLDGVFGHFAWKKDYRRNNLATNWD